MRRQSDGLDSAIQVSLESDCSESLTELRLPAETAGACAQLHDLTAKLNARVIIRTMQIPDMFKHPVSIVCHTNAGKSALFNLICRTLWLPLSVCRMCLPACSATSMVE